MVYFFREVRKNDNYQLVLTAAKLVLYFNER